MPELSAVCRALVGMLALVLAVYLLFGPSPLVAEEFADAVTIERYALTDFAASSPSQFILSPAVATVVPRR